MYYIGKCTFWKRNGKNAKLRQRRQCHLKSRRLRQNLGNGAKCDQVFGMEFITKVAQILGDFLGYFEKCHFMGINFYGYFWGNFS